MINVVIPAKDPEGAKSRLSEVLQPWQRRELALALFRQTLQFFADLPGAPHVLVVTDSPEMADIARAYDAEVLFETTARGETEAVNLATQWSLTEGFASQLVIPADMATLDAVEITELLRAERAAPSVVLCPATDDDGTNAILSTPPDAVAFRFGARSFPDYCRRARERGVPCEVCRLQSLVLDLDTPEDLDRFVQSHSESAVHRLVLSWNLPARSV